MHRIIGMKNSAMQQSKGRVLQKHAKICYNRVQDSRSSIKNYIAKYEFKENNSTIEKIRN